MTFTPFKPKFNKNDIIALNQDMVSLKTNGGGVFSKNHQFIVVSLYVSNTFDTTRYYGVLQPWKKDKQTNVQYIYTLQDIEDHKLTCQCEEQNICLIKRGNPNEISSHLIYARIGKEKTTYHDKPREDVPDIKLRKELKRLSLGKFNLKLRRNK